MNSLKFLEILNDNDTSSRCASSLIIANSTNSTWFSIEAEDCNNSHQFICERVCGKLVR